MTPPSRSKRILQAGGWTVGGYVFLQVTRLAGNLILTRLLVPEMFGLMALVYVLMSGLALLSDVGLGPNIVQSKRGEDPLFLNTVWVTQIIRGGALWALVLALAAWLHLGSAAIFPAESVYADSQLPLVVAVYSSIQFVLGFQSTKLALARRNYSLARITQIEMVSQIVTLIIMISWAALDQSIWALVGGTIVGALLRVLLSHVWVRGPSDSWRWDASAFREIWDFGKWVLLSSVLGFLVINGDRLMLGGLVTSYQLGLYSIAFFLASFPQQLAAQLATRVVYPVLSEVVRDKPDRLSSVYYKFRLWFDVPLLAVAGLLFTSGSAIVRLLYDSRYFGAGPILEVLAVSIIATRYQLVDQCFVALGRPRILTPLYASRLVLLYVLVPLAYWQYKLEGAIWAIALSPVLNLPLIFYFARQHDLLDMKKELVVLPAALLGAAVGAGISLAF